MIPLSGKIPPWLVLDVIALVGLALIFLPEGVNLRGYDVIPRELGSAFLIVVILAFTIDRWIKSHLLEDTVEATLGSIIHKDFRSELTRIMAYEFICEHHYMELSITEIGSHHVRVESIVERRLRNISGTSKEVQSMIHIDEWGVDGQKSIIEECYIVSSTNEKVNFKSTTFPNAYSMKAETNKVPIGPNGVVTLVTKASDVWSKNDHALGVFMSPTKNPMVRVTIPDTLHYEFDFGIMLGPGEKIDVWHHTHVHQLFGMYFPQAHMKIRWWPREWKAENHHTNSLT